MMTKKYGLIGYPLKQTFSPIYFNNKFRAEQIDADYQAYPLKEAHEFLDLVSKITFSGLNVTIPYKEQIIPFLDDIDEEAREIGAVNTIKIKDGKLKGYNTDVYGFEQSLLGLIEHPENISKAFILGTGGAAKAVSFIMKKHQIPFSLIGRSDRADYHYDSLDKNLFDEANLIINTTPLGMYPNQATKPDIPYKWLNKKYFLYDLVYNPEKTIFLSEGSQRDCKIKNGNDMVILQAEKAWEIWNHPVM